MQLLHSDGTLVHRPVNGRGNGQSTTDDGTDARQETREALGAGLAVDDLHRRDVVVEEDAGDAVCGMQAFLVAFVCGVAAAQGPLVRGHGVLVRFDAACGAVCGAVGAERGLVVGGVVDGGRDEGVPA